MDSERQNDRNKIHYLENGNVDVKLPNDLNKEELDLIEQLKELITKECSEINIDSSYSNPVDYDYLRFLRARKWVLKDSFQMMIKALIWRTENKPNLITIEDIESEYKKQKVYIHQYDLEGRLIYWIRVKAHKSSDSDPIINQKLCLYMMEKGFKNIKSEHPLCNVIFDMTDFSLSNMVL